MMRAEGPKMFELNTSALLEKSLKALPSQFRLEPFFAFYSFGRQK